MAPPIISPPKTRAERLRNWVEAWSPQVKQGTIGGIFVLFAAIGGWMFMHKSKPEISVASVSGGNNQFGNSNTMVVNQEPTNDIRSLEAILTYDLGLTWTKRGSKDSSSAIVGHQLLTLYSSADTNRPPIRFVTVTESTGIVDGLGLRGRYQLKLEPFSKKLVREELQTYDVIVSDLGLCNYEENVEGGVVNLKGVSVQMLLNAAELYQVYETNNDAIPLRNLAGYGKRIVLKARLFAPERRVR